MRSVRIIVGLAATVCVFAVAAEPVFASQFTASATGNTKGKAVGKQEFVFGNHLHIVCEAAKATGTVTETASPTFATSVKYSKCVREYGTEAQPEPLKAKFLGEVEYTYHANGYVELEGAIEIKVSGTKCLIEAPAQTIPVKAEVKPEAEYSAALYSEVEAPTTHLKKFPSGFQKKLVITNVFKTIEFAVSEGDCELWTKGTEGKAGRYNGTLEEELVDGNLAYEA